MVMHLRKPTAVMELGNHGQDPFSSEGLWRLSNFTLQSLQLLDPLHLDEGFPGGCRAIRWL